MINDDKEFCWLHMTSDCIVCERDQLQQIIKDAIKLCDENNIEGNIYDNFDVARGREFAADAIKEILQRPIKPSTQELQSMYEETEEE